MDPLPRSISAVEIPSDDDDDDDGHLPSPPLPANYTSPTAELSRIPIASPPHSFPQVLVLDDDDDPTPRKPTCPQSLFDHSPVFVPETVIFSRPAAIGLSSTLAPCSFARAPSNKIPGTGGPICLESDGEHEEECLTKTTRDDGGFVENGGTGNNELRGGSGEYGGAFSYDNIGVELEIDDWGNSLQRDKENIVAIAADAAETVGEDKEKHGFCSGEDRLLQQDNAVKKRGRKKKIDDDKGADMPEDVSRKKRRKEGNAQLVEERKQKRMEEKLQKEALKAEASELRKIQKEKAKWEKGKFALKSIVAEIDHKVVENGCTGGHLLGRFAEKGLTFRVTNNPMEKSIMWKMSIPEQISQPKLLVKVGDLKKSKQPKAVVVPAAAANCACCFSKIRGIKRQTACCSIAIHGSRRPGLYQTLSPMRSEVPYILFVYEAEEFCNMVFNGSLLEHVHSVQKRFQSFTVCYLTNKLMSYINKREQNQYKNPSNASCWKRPPVEEVLSKLTTHFTRVHSRLCMDEADLSEHIVGLTTSLASCQFRSKLTWLSINANGSLVPKGFIDRHLIKKSAWLKALTALPKVQPRYAISIWKKYPTMRSLLNVYLDPSKTVHEKEFLLKDLPVEGALGKEDKRLGDACSKRVFRILMAQNGASITDDVENGADFFSSG